MIDTNSKNQPREGNDADRDRHAPADTPAGVLDHSEPGFDGDGGFTHESNDDSLAQRPEPGTDPAQPASDDDNANAEKLKKNAKRSIVYMLCGRFGSEFLRLVSNLVLTRLLAPDVYGLMVLVNVILTGLKMFSDVGVGPSIIQNKRTDRTFLDTAWTVQVIRGFVLLGIAVALSYPAAAFYDEPWLKVLLPVAALSALIAGFNSTAIFSQHRAVRMDKIVLLQFIAQATMVAAMIGWAVWISRDVWSLVIGGIVSATVYAVLSHVWIEGPKNRLCFDKQAFKDLNRFGIWVLLGTICTFIATQADRAVFGRLFEADQLGLYGIALFLSTGLANIVQLLSRQVLFPVLAETARTNRALMMPRLIRARWKFNLLAMPATGLLFGAGPVIVALMYDDRYLGAGWMLQILAVYGATTCLIMPGTNALMALGLPKNNFQVNLARAIWMAAAIPAGWFIGGYYGNAPAGALWAVGLSGITGYVVVSRGLAKNKMYRWQSDAEGLAMFLGGGVLGVLIQLGVNAMGWTF